ncbi:MAG: NIL domain-containing protein [Propioniciclava sp.]|uniref:NIL domain-containing protein n=1 Tax=Propioniciclava sp. TaxID=2038686 RepID=UPI0039E3AFC4
MTLDLVFVGADAGRATLGQLSSELGVSFRLLAQRETTMEIFPVSVLTVELSGDAPRLHEASRWIASRGVHRLATAA